MTPETLTIAVPDAIPVSGLHLRPEPARALYVLAHGAGAGMTHPFLIRMARNLYEEGIATLRFQFPYKEKGRRWPPDRAPVLEKTTIAAVKKGAELAGELPLFAGGKSMGGRYASIVAAKNTLPPLAGLIFLGFPLHSKKKPDTKRADHLGDVPAPMLFLQGTRDDLADLTLLRPIVEKLEHVTLTTVEGADHGFRVRKKDPLTEEEVRERLRREIAGWVAALGASD